MRILAHAEEFKKDQDQYEHKIERQPNPVEVESKHFWKFFEENHIDFNSVDKTVKIQRSSLNVEFSVRAQYANTFLDKISHITENLMNQIPQDTLDKLGFRSKPELDFFNAIPLSSTPSRFSISYPPLDIPVNVTVWKTSSFTLENGGIRFVQLMTKSLNFKQQYLWNSHRYFHFLFNDPNSTRKNPLELERLPPNDNGSALKTTWATQVLTKLKAKGFEKKVPIEKVESNKIYFKETKGFSYFFLITWNSDFSKLCEAEISSRMGGAKIVLKLQFPTQKEKPAPVDQGQYFFY